MAIQRRTKRTAPRRSRSTGTKIDFMKAAGHIGFSAAAIAGVAVGNLVVKKLSKSNTVSGLVGLELKEYIAPASVTVLSLIGIQFTNNPYMKTGLTASAGAGLGIAIEKLTGKSLTKSISGLFGDDGHEYLALDPAITQTLPAVDLDIEQEVQRSISGVEDFSMSDEPIGATTIPSNMASQAYVVAPYEEVGNPVVSPDSMDFDIFSGDMMES